MRVLAEGKDSAKVTLSEVMTRDPTAMPPGKSAIDALRLMQDGGFRHVPVVDNGKVVGAVSKGAICGASSRTGSMKKPASGSGSERRQADARPIRKFQGQGSNI
jgi:predicted transcriptional regulator